MKERRHVGETSHLASWLRKKELDAAAALQLARIELETAEEPPVDSRGRHPGDARRLRGIPILAKGVGSAIPGTDPLSALLAKAERLEESLAALFGR